jgi:NTP pyrophosphatase (non-canonical NTP hydrolase)
MMNKYQNRVDDWFQSQGWEYWAPMEILARLTEEVGEFARVINDRFGPKDKKSTEAVQQIEEEIGDIMFTLICFANAQDIDLDEAIQSSIDKVADRDADRFD